MSEEEENNAQQKPKRVAPKAKPSKPPSKPKK